jgi:hypothetical protein
MHFHDIVISIIVGLSYVKLVVFARKIGERQGIWVNKKCDDYGNDRFLPFGEPLLTFQDGIGGVSILFIGDSLDKNMLEVFCGKDPKSGVDKVENFFTRPTNCTSLGETYADSTDYRFGTRPGYRSSFGCKSANNDFIMANFFFAGLNLYGVKNFCEAGIPYDNFEAADAVYDYFKSYNSRDPDVVVVKSLYWDIADIIKVNAGYFESISKYEMELTKFVKHLQRRFNSSEIVLKSDPMWNRDANRFKNSPVHVHRLGMSLMSIARSVADKLNLTYFDFFHMFEHLDPKSYLRDDIHLQEKFSVIEMSIFIDYILNKKLIYKGQVRNHTSIQSYSDFVLDGSLIKFQDSPSRQIYLCANQTLFPIDNPDTVSALGLSMNIIKYINSNEANNFSRSSFPLNMYVPQTSPGGKGDIDILRDYINGPVMLRRCSYYGRTFMRR